MKRKLRHVPRRGGPAVSWDGDVAADHALGVNYRTVARCQQSRRVSRRVRQVLQELGESQGVANDGYGVVVGDDKGSDTEETPAVRAARLEEENRELREMVEAQAEELEVLRRRVAGLEDRGHPAGGVDAVDGDQGRPGDWVPPGVNTGCLAPV